MSANPPPVLSLNETYSAQEADIIFQLLKTIASSLDMSKVASTEQIRKLYTASKPLADKSPTAKDALITLAKSVLCAVCQKQIGTVELVCRHVYCSRCFEAQVMSSTGGLAVTNPGEPQATCYCGGRVHLEDLERLSRYQNFVAAARERLEQPLCRYCFRGKSSSFHSCYCDECLAKDYGAGLRVCRSCGTSIEQKQGLPQCEECQLKVMPPCIVQTSCCPRRVCVVCQLETNETQCLYCHSALPEEATAQLQNSKKQLEYLAQTEPALFSR